MSSFLVASIILLACVPLSSQAADSPAKAVEEEVQIVEAFDCTHDKDVRRLEVLTREAGCSLQYYKFGKRNEMAVAKRGVEVCKGGLKKIRTTLEASGYQCK